MTMFKIPMRFKKQAGYMLLEGALALSVAGGIMSYYLADEKNRFAEDMAKIHAQHMAHVSTVVNEYVANNYAALSTGAAVAGYANPLRPTIAELRADGYNITNNAPIYGGNIEVRLRRYTAGGIDHVAGFVTTTQPVAPGGQVSSRAIGRALQEIGFNAHATGLSGHNNNTLARLNQNLATVDYQVSTDLPGITAAQGLMAVRVGTDACDTTSAAGCNLFLRVDGSNSMTNALNMGGNNIRNVANIGTAAAAAGTVFTTDLSIAGSVVTNLDMGTNNITNANNITANQNIISSSGSIFANGTGANGNITANRNIISNTGNITASAGSISANGTGANGNITAANKITTKDLQVTGVVTNTLTMASGANLNMGKNNIQNVQNIGESTNRVENLFTKILNVIGVEAETVKASNYVETKDLKVTGKMLADLDMGNKNINNANNVNAANLTATGLAKTTNLQVTGTVQSNLNMNNNNISNANTVSVKTLNAATAVDTADLKVSGKLLSNLNMDSKNITNANVVYTTDLSVSGRVITALNMNNNNITNAGTIGATKVDATNVNATNLTASNGTTTNNLSVNGGMLTHLNMNSKNINSANQVNGATINATGNVNASLDVNAGRLLKSNDKLYVQGIMDVKGSSYVQALQALSIAISGTSTLGGSCGSNHVSKDSSGNTLLCNGGVWKKAGANSVWLSGWHDTGLGNPWRQCPAGMVVTRVDANFAEKKLGVGCQYINVN
jgi:hypothetical protein